MANKKMAWVLVALTISVISHQALALEPDPNKTGFIPSVTVGESYDDNVWRARSGEVESWITTVAPSLVFRAKDGLNLYQFKYDLLHDEVHSSKDDSHTDHDAKVLARIEFTARHRLDFNLSYVDETQERDSSNRFFNETGDEISTFDGGFIYGFGAKSAKGQVDIGLNMGQRRYDNNRNSGSFNRQSEYDRKGGSGAFYYRVGAKTRVLAEVIYIDYDYKSSTSLLSGDSKIYRVGVEWNATAKTGGRISFGRENRDYDASSISSVSRPSWAASVRWQPKTYSTFTLSSEGLIWEGGGTETSTEVTATELTWDHEWTTRWNSHIGYKFENYDYQASFFNNREDDVDTVSLGLNYKMRRWLDVSLFYEYSETDSNNLFSEYDRNVLGMKIGMSF
ncbi:MAG: outer membrane beta-barrel protein [Porticoccaceae bacterium]|nr:outer membrane beta-barrel protein [Porticoccaceae bacterium]